MIKLRIVYWLILVVWLGVIYLLSAFPSLQIEEIGLWDLVFRKLAHMTEFFILALIFSKVIGFSIKKNYKILIVTIAFGILYAISDEVHQLFVPGRVGSVIDIMIDGLGVLLGAAVFFIYQRCLKKSVDLK